MPSSRVYIKNIIAKPYNSLLCRYSRYRRVGDGSRSECVKSGDSSYGGGSNVVYYSSGTAATIVYATT